MLVSTEQPHLQESRPAELCDRSVYERSSPVSSPVCALVIALLSPFLALKARCVQRALFAVVILDIPLQLGTHLFYREADAASGALAGLSISVTTLAMLALCASWLIRTREETNREKFRWPQGNGALLCYLGFSVLSALGARDPRLSAFELFFLLQMYLVFLYVTHFVRKRGDVLFVLGWLLAGCLVESILIAGLRFANASSSLWGPLHFRVDHGANSDLTRVGGTIGSPNEAGAYLAIVTSLALSMLFAGVARRIKWLAASVVVFGGAALVFTFSRGAWAAFVLSTILLGFFVGRRKRVSVKAIISIAAILFFMYLPFHNEVNDRLFSDDNGSAGSRVPLMKLAFRMIADNPILGVGSNNFSAAMDDYVSSEFRTGFLYTVHNKYLLIWAENGPGGLLAYLAFFIAVLQMGRACWKQNDPFLSTAALGLSVALIGSMLHQSLEILQDRAITQLLWLMAGLVVAIHGILRRESAAARSLSWIT